MGDSRILAESQVILYSQEKVLHRRRANICLKDW
jgi:hypothetical protein